MSVLRWIFVFIITISSLYAAEVPATALSFSAVTIDGDTLNLETYQGKVVMVVNVASRCGFTKQYEQLQQIYETYGEQGFVVLGFPCNQFMKQEKGTNDEIKAFCQKNFGVTFPMFSKIDVKGKQAHPLYQYLTSDMTPIADHGKVKWNFEKFLIDRSGTVVERYRSRVKPDAPEVIEAIEKALGEHPEEGFSQRSQSASN